MTTTTKKHQTKRKIKSNVRTLYKWWSFCTNMLLTSITKLNKFSELGCAFLFLLPISFTVSQHWMKWCFYEWKKERSFDDNQKNWYKLQNDYNIRCRYQEMSSLITTFNSFVHERPVMIPDEIGTKLQTVKTIRKAFQKKKRKIKSIIQIKLTHTHTE